MSVLRELKRRVAASKARFIEPCLPTLSETLPTGPRWIHEIKHDGFRLRAHRSAAGVHLVTRNGYDWTTRYPAVVTDLKALACKSCIVDGEVVVLDDNGTLPIFDRLRYGPREKPEAQLFAFDLLELNGEDIRGKPVEKRKAALKRLLAKRIAPPKGEPRPRTAIYLVDHLEHADGAIVFEHACALGCEGIVSKRLGSPYPSGRSRDWIKVKNPAAPSTRRLEEEDWNG
jgi:bifunctional non-homologous end joining protein LigD